MFGQLIPAGGGIPIPLLNKRILVGRDTGCDVVIPSKAISDQHCELKLKDGYWWVRDLDSRNGTGINGKKISRKRILPKQVLCVPKMRFRIVYDAPAAKPAEIPDDAMVLNFLAEDATPTKSPSKPKHRTPSDTPASPREEHSAERSSQPSKSPTEASNAQTERKRFLGKLTPSGGGEPIALLQTKLNVGRSRSSDIRLKFASVSSRHCNLEYEDGYWFVEDLGSSNGVRVNGEKVDRRVLMPGDKLSISSQRFVIDYKPVGEPPRDMSLLSKSLLEKAGLQDLLDSDHQPGWITSHEEKDDNRRIKYRLDDSDPD